jgi:hypothetical protein
MEQRRITDAELRDLEALLRTLAEDSELMAGLSILERGEIESTCTVVRSLIGKSGRFGPAGQKPTPEPRLRPKE